MSELSLSDRIDAVADRVRAKHAADRVARAEADAARAADVERRRAVLRDQMPEVAGVVDAFRAVGVSVSVLAAAEGGHVVVNHAACERMGVDVSGYVQKD